MKDLSCSASGAAAPGIHPMSVELEQLDSGYALKDHPGLLDDTDAPAQITGVMIDYPLLQLLTEDEPFSLDRIRDNLGDVSDLKGQILTRKMQASP